jgi:glycosyltransferase involved in cell wall biosynthesis
MRIGINLYPLALRGGGMRQYVLQLIPWLLRLSAHRIQLFHGSHGQPSVAAILRQLAPPERCRVRAVEIEHQDEIFGYADRFDLYFCPLNCFYPNLLDRPTVATLADVQEQFFPEYFTPEQRQMRAELYPRTAHAVTTLITISEFSKQAICRAFNVSADKVKVTYLAANEEMRNARPEWPAPLPPLPGRFVLYPANLYPHKNHQLLLEAVRQLKESHGIDCACALTGHEAKPGVAIQEMIEAQGLRDRAIWLGHVSPAALRHLYAQALALCFPSQFEGFGMPLVEAMLCGCPVIATPTASIPEVVGDAALLVEPTPAGLADAVARLLQEPSLRQELIARGRARVARFDARVLAKQTLQILEEASTRFHAAPTEASQRSRVAYVVHSGKGGPALAQTLASLSFEVRNDDEVAIKGASPWDPRAIALEANLPGARRVESTGPANWLDEVNADIVCYLREGECLCEGARSAALAALAEAPECVAVVGEAIAIDNHGHMLSSRFATPPSGIQPAGALVPPAAVFWRQEFLRQQRSLLDSVLWTNHLLVAARGRTRTLHRTFALVDAKTEPGGAVPGLVRLLRDRHRFRGRVPSLSLRQIIRTHLIARLWQARGQARLLLRFLLPGVEAPLRRLYLQKIRPHASER